METQTKTRRFLTMADQMSHEELMEKRRNYTDEDVRKFGYPSAEVMLLEDDLAHISGKWRRTKDEELIDEYRDVLFLMMLKGYDVTALPIQYQLPEDKMPFIPPMSVSDAIVKAYRELED